MCAPVIFIQIRENIIDPQRFKELITCYLTWNINYKIEQIVIDIDIWRSLAVAECTCILYGQHNFNSLIAPIALL